MKKHLTILFLILVITRLSAQEYLTIDFTGNTSIDSLYVENITKGTHLMINGSDTLLLVIESTLLNQYVFIEPSINIYPNPSSDVSYIQYISTKPSEIMIEICDMSGHVISKRNIYLEKDQHLFSISGLSIGIYIVKVTAESKVLTERLVITNNSKENLSFTYSGISKTLVPQVKMKTNDISVEKSMQKRNTKNTIEMDFDIGDQLLVIGYANSYENTTIYISPTEDQTFELDFGECISPTCPEVGIHSNSQTQIIWNWSTSIGADGYKYNNINSFESAFNNGTNTSYTQSGLNCSTVHTLYVWAYNNCGESDVLVLSEETEACPWVCGDVFIDSRDGTTYQTVQIGNQCWMAENLKYLQSVVGPGTYSESVPYYYVYGYNGTNVSAAKATSNYTTYGVLYNWPAAMAGSASSQTNPSGVQGICPAGWHLPSDAEWTELTDDLGGLSVAGKKLKDSMYVGATNESGFSALLGGYRYSDGVFYSIELYSHWWSATEDDSSKAWDRFVRYDESTVTRYDGAKELGVSVRCVRDF